jgi:antirestriction protein ArdC
MGAAFLCAIAGIANENTERNTSAYIQNWISKLEEDNRLILHASTNAQRAVDSIVGSPVSESEGEGMLTGIPSGTTSDGRAGHV